MIGAARIKVCGITRAADAATMRAAGADFLGVNLWPGSPRHAPAERQKIIVDRLVRYFGEAARNPIAYAEQDWCGEEWSGGGPVAIFPTGALSVHGSALRDPIGRIHWAGTETASVWSGYMDGALQSGERAAAEVLAAS